MVVYDDAASVAGLNPDFSALGRLDRAVLVTAPGGDVDFVSRFFAPSSRHPGRSRYRLDPLHATPYWAERLGKTELSARQLSARGGQLKLRLAGDRVLISGTAVLYLEGTVYL